MSKSAYRGSLSARSTSVLKNAWDLVIRRNAILVNQDDFIQFLLEQRFAIF